MIWFRLFAFRLGIGGRNLLRFIFDFITVSKLKQSVIAGKSLQSSVATAFQTFVRVRLYVNLGRMA